MRTVTTNESLALALRHLAEDPRFQSMVDVRLDLDLPESDRLSPERTEHVLAIVTEALSNVVRHANARHVQISCTHISSELVLEVTDDGQGIYDRTYSGYGLRNMRDRARLLGGRLEVASWPGKGTTIRLVAPWEETHA